MASKWQVNLALRQSTLPPPSRHIMLALSDIADPKTAVIPDERTPSLAELTTWTGYDKSTVTRHLDLLDETGWLHRDRPDRIVARRDGVRTKYRLMVPRGALCTTGDEPEQAVDGDPVVHSAPERGAQETTPRGAEDITPVVHRTPRPVVHSAPVPYTDEVTNDKTSSTSENATQPKRRSSKQKSPPDRPDVERLCEHLADRIVANGCNRPNINKNWRDAARRLLDLDGRTEEQVHKCIDWATSNRFWRKNILSMPTLREKYDRLRMDAEDERGRANGRASPGRQLVEHNGMHLKPETIADIERTQRFAALDAQDAKQLAIGGTP